MSAKGPSPPPLDAIRTIIVVIRGHQAMFAEPLSYAVDSAVDACLVAFPGVGAAAVPAAEPQEDIPVSGDPAPPSNTAAEVCGHSMCALYGYCREMPV